MFLFLFDYKSMPCVLYRVWVGLDGGGGWGGGEEFYGVISWADAGQIPGPRSEVVPKASVCERRSCAIRYTDFTNKNLDIVLF